MATTKTITDYAAAGSTDATNDYFLGYNAAATAYRKYNRNTLLGITGLPVGTTDSQTLTNKTLTSPTINGVTLSGTLSGTYTIGGTPTFPASVVTLTGSQTLTNKTLTSPAISGGSISNSTIAVDSISGFSTSTIVTVGGVQMNNGTIATSGAVTSTSIGVGAVQPQALTSGTGSGWSWQSYTPTFTNATTGNGSATGKYIQIGKTVFFSVRFTFGTTSAFTGTVSFSLPVTSVNYGTAGSKSIGIVTSLRPATAAYFGQALWTSTTTCEPDATSAVSTYATSAPITASAPQTWQAADTLDVTGFYEAA